MILTYLDYLFSLAYDQPMIATKMWADIEIDRLTLGKYLVKFKIDKN